MVNGKIVFDFVEQGQKTRSDHDKNIVWVQRAHERQSIDFLLMDPKNKIDFLYLPAKEGKFHVFSSAYAKTRKIKTAKNEKNRKEIENFLKKHNITKSNKFAGDSYPKTLRIRESCIFLGSQISIFTCYKKAYLRSGVDTYFATQVESSSFTDNYFSHNQWSRAAQQAFVELGMEHAFHISMNKRLYAKMEFKKGGIDPIDLQGKPVFTKVAPKSKYTPNTLEFNFQEDVRKSKSIATSLTEKEFYDQPQDKDLDDGDDKEVYIDADEKKLWYEATQAEIRFKQKLAIKEQIKEYEKYMHEDEKSEYDVFDKTRIYSDSDLIAQPHKTNNVFLYKE